MILFSGVAEGLVFLPTMTLLQQYFDKNMGLAVGVAFSGVGMGQIVGPPLFVYLVGEYGLKGTLLIWAGIQSHHFLCAILMRPTHFYSKGKRSRDMKTVNHGILKSIESKLSVTNVEKNSSKSGECSKTQHRAKLIDTELLKNVQFVLFNLALFFLFMANMPMRGLVIAAHGNQVGLNAIQVALLATLIGVGTFIGRPLLCFMVDLKLLPTPVYFSMLSASTGILLIAAPHVGRGMVVMCILSAVIGFTSAVTVPLPGVLLRELVEPQQYATACGWMGVSMGLPNLFNYVLYGKYI